MKLIYLFAISLILGSLSLSAETINSLSEDEAKIDAAMVQRTSILGENKDKDLQIRAVVTYDGQSSDVSPSHNLYVTFFDGGEVNNTRTVFKLGKFFEVKSTKRLSAGVYQIEVVELDEEVGGFVTKALTITTYQIFKDNKALELEEFEDVYFTSSIDVSVE